MKIFKDLEFNTDTSELPTANIKFENGYGATIIDTKEQIEGYGPYELMVVSDDGWLERVNSPLKFLTKRDVTELLIKIQQL
jgi:hypothetical protein